MPILLNPETEKLLEASMKCGGYSSADEMVRAALETPDRSELQAIEDLDAATHKAIAFEISGPLRPKLKGGRWRASLPRRRVGEIGGRGLPPSNGRGLESQMRWPCGNPGRYQACGGSSGARRGAVVGSSQSRVSGEIR